MSPAAIRAEALTSDELNNQGVIHYQNKEFEQALDAFEKAYLSNPQNDAAWNNLYNTYLAIENEYANQATELNNQGAIHYQNGEWEQALNAFERVYLFYPQEDTVRRNLYNAYAAVANEYASRHDYQSAINFFEAALPLAADGDELVLVQLGVNKLRVGRLVEAIQHLEDAVFLNPDNLNAHALLGDAYLKDEDYPSALAQWELVYHQNSDYPQLAEKIAKAWREYSVEYNFRNEKTRHFQFSYAAGTSVNDLQKAVVFLEEAYTAIGRRLGGVYPSELIQVKVYTADDFSKVTLLGEHVGAVYDGTIKLPIKDKQNVSLTERELRRRLYHEYTHVIVKEIVGTQAPWWVNEGLAETLSDTLTDAAKERFSALRREGKLFRLQDLEANQLTALQPDKLEIAYLQSHIVVNHLWTRYGERSFTNFLGRLGRGDTVAEALRLIYNKTFANIESEINF